MNEWEFIGQESLVALGKSATSFKYKSRRGYVRDERFVLSNPHSSYLIVRMHLLPPQVQLRLRMEEMERADERLDLQVLRRAVEKVLLSKTCDDV